MLTIELENPLELLKKMLNDCLLKEGKKNVGFLCENALS